MSPQPRHLLVLTALTLATWAAPARAVWGPDSVLTLGRTLSCGVINARIFPGPAATFDVVWHGKSCTGIKSNGAARVTRDGGLVFSVPLDYGELPAVAPDGSGGLVIASSVDTCYCGVRQIVFRDFDAAGTPDPPNNYYWADQGPGGFDMNPAAAADPAGGVYVAWLDDPYTMLQRMSSDEVVAPGWPPEGLPLSPADIMSPGLMPDGSGGVYVLNLPRVYRVQSDGTPAPGWPVTGRAVTTTTASNFPVTYPANLGLVASESGHVFAPWFESSGRSNRIIVRSF